MENENIKLTVEKDSNKFAFVAMGIFQAGLGLFITIALIKGIINRSFETQNILLSLLVIVIAIPLGFYHLSYAFGDRVILDIDTNRIMTKKKKINWTDIYEVETTKYLGPRMEFYRIKIFQDFERTNKVVIWFSSDIKPDWTQIIECLSYYTARHNIIST